MDQTSRPQATALKLGSSVVPKALRTLLRLAAAFSLLLILVALIPSREIYYRAESLLSHFGPLGSTSQHIRGVPSTAFSIVMEAFQDRSLEIEGVPINLDYAVNPSEYVEEHKFSSQVLGEERTYWIYLPPGYQETNERYPTLYLLHGMSQGHRWWAEVARIDRIATSMISSGKIRPTIIVMPNGNRVESNVSTTSLYDDRCSTGLDIVAKWLKAIGDRLEGLSIYHVSCDADFGRFIHDELVEEVDANFRTTDERYLGGFSIGARGALQLALGNDNLFDGAFGLSGNYDFLRQAIRGGNINPQSGMKLFLGSGNQDQRGVYGELSTFLFHKDLLKHETSHLYCTYDGSHSDVSWVTAVPKALEYLLAADYNPHDSQDGDISCRSTP